MKEVIQLANQVVNETEQNWLQQKWDEFQMYQELGACGDHILEEIAEELERLNLDWEDFERE